MRNFALFRSTSDHHGRLEVLDGLRGTAALFVVIFHLFQMATPRHEDTLFGHTYLAVDFFFCMSGYVLGYAYDRHRGIMTRSAFLRARIIRLHPLILMGILLGLTSYVLDPFAGSARDPSANVLALATLAGALSLPGPAMTDRWDAYFPLNPPGWSMLWEYVASAAYAFFLWRIRLAGLAIVTAAAAACLIWVAYVNGGLATGFTWATMPYGLARAAFSFPMGLLLFRLRIAIASRIGWLGLSICLAAIFLVPYSGNSWLFDSLVVLIVLPVIVALSAGATSGNRGVNPIALALGRLSYPLYITHYALATPFLSYVLTHTLSRTLLPFVVAVITASALLLAELLLRVYDQPVRRWLTRTTTRPVWFASTSRPRGAHLKNSP